MRDQLRAYQQAVIADAALQPTGVAGDYYDHADCESCGKFTRHHFIFISENVEPVGGRDRLVRSYDRVCLECKHVVDEFLVVR